MASPAVSGTFTGTGSSNAVAAGKVMVDMTFSGTATVNVQWLVDGSNWRTITAYTASAQVIVESGGLPVRLNCSAYTDNVAYAIVAK
jgi:hypothetical protein